MYDCDPLLAALRNDAAAQEWAGTCSSLKAIFEKLPADAKAALVASDGCVSALLHAIARECEVSCSDDETQAAALRGACDALNALITDLPKGVKQTLLSGDKGVVDELLRVMSDVRGQCVWGSVGFCFRNLLLNVDAEARQRLLSDGRGNVEAIVGVLDGDEASAWAGAGGTSNSFWSGVTARWREGYCGSYFPNYCRFKPRRMGQRLLLDEGASRRPSSIH